MFCFHKWSKWSDIEEAIMADKLESIGFFAVAQYRTCKKCGIVKVRKLPKLRSLKGIKKDSTRLCGYDYDK